MKKEDIIQLFDSFNNMKVLIVGDAMIDAYMWGKIERQSPEAAVPVVEIEKHENRLGGAGNVTRNIKSLGATFIGTISFNLPSLIFGLRFHPVNFASRTSSLSSL